MRWTAVVWIGLLAPLSGCNIAYYAGHNLINEPISRWDEHKLDKRLLAESRAAWREVCRQYPARTFTPEFADGFQEGYADYLDHGGTPRPPVVPPPRYRRARYLTPEGNARARDYLIGFKYGADVAAATGRREFLTVPVALSEPQPEVPLSITHLPIPPETSVETPGVLPEVPPAPTSPLPIPGVPMPSRPDDGKSPEPTATRPEPAPVTMVAIPTVPVAATVVPSHELPDVIPPAAAPPAPLPPLAGPPAAPPPAADPR